MGLGQWQGTHAHARISRQGDDKIQTRNTHQSAELTPPAHQSQILSQEAIHQRRSGVPPLSKEEGKHVQAVSGTLLYYGRAVNPTILPALSSIATEQAKPTKKTMAMVKQLLDYCATQEEAIITYTASKMILCIHSDAGYANEKNTRSRAGGHFPLSNNNQHPLKNGAIMTNETIIKADMSSAVEAEL